MNRLYFFLGILGATACASSKPSAELAASSESAEKTTAKRDGTVPESSVTKDSAVQSQGNSKPRLGATILFTGMCDASGAVPLSTRTFMVADDEDNVLRVYDAEQGGAPLWSKDISSELELPAKKGKPPKEMDIEAATQVDDLAFWLTSYGRNSSGKLKTERFRFFATKVSSEEKDSSVVGYAGADLLDALIADPRYSGFGLKAASELAPKAPGGLNIEGMTQRVEGGVWIGFRNPNPGGKALLAPLLNPLEMIRGDSPQFGEPQLLDLKGHGVRSLSSWHGKYLIVAGHYDQDPQRPSTLYEWDGGGVAQQVSSAHLAEFNPEGFFTPENRQDIMLLSDDGVQVIDGVECKRQDDATKKQFRGVWMRL